MKFTIYGRLDGLNEYTKACRNNKFGGNNMKKKNQRKVLMALAMNEIEPIDNFPIKLSIVWYEPNRRRDIDNVTFAVKFILDALVADGILKDDSQKYVSSIEHTVLVDKDNPRIVVEIEGSDSNEQSL